MWIISKCVSHAHMLSHSFSSQKCLKCWTRLVLPIIFKRLEAVVRMNFAKNIPFTCIFVVESLQARLHFLVYVVVCISLFRITYLPAHRWTVKGVHTFNGIIAFSYSPERYLYTCRCFIMSMKTKLSLILDTIVLHYDFTLGLHQSPVIWKIAF